MRNKLFLFVFLFAVLAIVDSHAFERKKYNFNSEWRLQIGDFPEAKQSQFDDSRWKAVTLPHAFNEDEAFKCVHRTADGHSGMVSETLSDSGFR
mgnify:CR=1 FL=1